MWMLLTGILIWTCVVQASDPVQIRNHRSASLAFLRLPARPHTLESQEARLSYSLVIANEFRRIGPIDEDAETWRLGFGYREGLGDGIEVFAEIPFLIRGGGVMDPVIDWWHNVILGTPNPLRDSTVVGRSQIEYPGADSFGSATGLGDVSVGVARQMGDNAVASVAVKLPTGNPSMLTGSGAFDFGAGLDLRLSLCRNIVLNLNGGYVVQGASPRLGDVRRGVYASSVSASWNQNSRDAWSLIWSTEQSPTKTGDALLDGDHRIVSFAYVRRYGNDTLIEAFFSEDGDFRWFRFPGGATVGPDLTFGIRISRALNKTGRR